MVLMVLGNLPDDAEFDMASWDSCAIGHAMNCPKLQAEGLTPFRLHGGLQWPTYDGNAGMSAVMRFFGLPAPISNWLFGAHTYGLEQRTDPNVTISRIQAVLRDPEEFADLFTGGLP